MKINKQELQTALEIVKPGLAGKEIIEQSTSFAFKDGMVVTYNDEISVSHPVPGLDIRGAVRSEELYQFLNKVSKDTIDISVSENEVLLKAGKAKAGLRLQTEIVLPLEEIGDGGDWVKLPEDFIPGIRFVMDSCSRDHSRPVLTCIHIKQELAEGSDGFQIMKYLMSDNMDVDILIPASSAKELGKVKPTHLALGDGWIHFKNAQDTMFSCRVLDEGYPNTEPHMKVKGSKVTFPKRMPEILERAMIFTKQDQQADETMEVTLTAGAVLVKGRNEYAWFEEEAKARYKGKDVSFHITPTLLGDILNRSNTCTLGKDKIKFEGDNWEYIAALQNVG